MSGYPIWIISGEGENGSWDRKRVKTDRGAKRILSAARCGGDRWAYAYLPLHMAEYGPVGTDIETGEMHFLPDAAGLDCKKVRA